MADVKYNANLASNKNIITAVISLVVTYMLCKNKGKKKKKKVFGTFAKSFNLISQLWMSFALKKKSEKVKEDTFPVKIEKAKIINL